MLISHRYRFIYTKTAKTAGTSIESFFERFCMPEGEWAQSHLRDEYESPDGVIGYRGGNPPATTQWKNHMSAAAIKERIGADIWSSYFKFCAIRDPFDKCISAFSHFGRDWRTDDAASLAASATPPMTAEQYRFFDYIGKRPPVDRDKYVIDGEFCLDDTIRYERLEADLERICARIGVPFGRDYLPTFKKGVRGRGATIESLYTEQARRLVEETFALELSLFGYRFPEAGT